MKKSVIRLLVFIGVLVLINAIINKICIGTYYASSPVPLNPGVGYLEAANILMAAILGSVALRQAITYTRIGNIIAISMLLINIAGISYVSWLESSASPFYAWGALHFLLIFVYGMSYSRSRKATQSCPIR